MLKNENMFIQFIACTLEMKENPTRYRDQTNPVVSLYIVGGTPSGFLESY